MKVLGTVEWRLALAAALSMGLLQGQNLSAQGTGASTVSPLDPTRSIAQPALESSRHKPLAEEFIWTASGASAGANANKGTEPHYFLRRFTVGAVPQLSLIHI